jgi:hypothetical protein
MTLKRIMMVAAIVEIATGLALVFAPMLVVQLLLGVYAPWTSISIGRVAGVAILALGVSCLSWRESGPTRPAAWRGMLAYQTLVAAYLAYLSVVGGIGGVLLWPAVVFHAAMAAMLAWLGKSFLVAAKGTHGE